MKTPYTTYTLLALNVLVFIVLALNLQSLEMNTQRDALAILHLGSNVNPLTLGGQPWRIVTSMFLHFGIWHLAINMLALYSLGTTLESAVGSVRLVLIYFFCGITANLFSLELNVYANSAGASGALFGLYGYNLGAYLISGMSDSATRRRVLISFIIFVVLNGMIAVIVSVDLWGHIGGFVGGFLLAIAQLRLRWLIKNRHLATALACMTAVMFVLPKDQVRYYRLYQAVLAQERTTENYYRHELSDAEILDSLRFAVTKWDSLKYAFHSIGRVRKALHHDTAVMRQYIKLHRRATEYRVSLLSRQSYVYFDSIEIANAAFRSITSPQYILNYYPLASEASTASDSSSARELISRRVFYDAEWREINDPSAALYYRIGQTDSAGRWQGAVRDYYRNGDIQMKGSYKDNLKDGVFLYYSDHNTYTSAGRYQREDAIGKWESFHWNGNLHMETYYNSKTFVGTVLDSLGNAQVRDGQGVVTSWHSNGQIAETGQYHNGMRMGDWFGYHPDGSPYYREQYRDNRLVQGASVDEAGKRYVYDQLSLYAYPVKGMDYFDQYVRDNIRRPYPRASGARIRVLFQVGRNGEMWDFVIVEGSSPEHETEAIRLIKEGPAWRRGLLHGHIPVPSQGYAVIVF